MGAAPDEGPRPDSVPESPWVVFLHGQPGTASDWQPVISELPADIRTLTLDRPGYASNPDAPSDINGNAEWLIAELDKRGIDEAILVGHSLGGGVALATAALAPERVTGLALVASIGPDCLDGWDTLLASPFVGPILTFVALWVTPWWPAAAWRAFVHEQRALMRSMADLDRYVDAVHAPAVVIADPRDRVVRVTVAQSLRERLRKARLVLAPGGGHDLPRRRPHLIASEIAQLAHTVR